MKKLAMVLVAGLGVMLAGCPETPKKVEKKAETKTVQKDGAKVEEKKSEEKTETPAPPVKPADSK
jgi:starvation-inducible outer membrane lipoprotein